MQCLFGAERFEHSRARGRVTVNRIAIVRGFAVASLVFWTSTAANVTVNVSLSLVLGDELGLLR
jgi:hypothetical protein